MTPDQERLIRAVAAGKAVATEDDPLAQRKPNRIVQTLAAVLLELADKVARPMVTRSWDSLSVAEKNAVGATAAALERRGRHSLRLQMEHAVTGLTAMTPASAKMVVDSLLDILDCDPGHDATYGYLKAGENRCQTVEAYRAVIQAIRRGE